MSCPAEPCRGSVTQCGGEVSGHLVGLPVFKTGDAENLGVAGSIPVHLRAARTEGDGQ